LQARAAAINVYVVAGSSSYLLPKQTVTGMHNRYWYSGRLPEPLFIKLYLL